MNRSSRLLCVTLLAVSSGACAAPRAPWVSAYYPGWRQSRLPPAAIDYDAFTHLIHFSVIPRPDGSLDAATNVLTPANVAAAVAAARAAGRKILITVGGQGSRDGFTGAMSGARRPHFIAALVSYMRDNGYDGIDVDMEPLETRDARDFTAFIRELRAALDAIEPRPLLTAAVLWEPALFARLAGSFDQVNLMTYNLSGPYPGWVVWHSGALYDGGKRFADGRKSLPSVDGVVRDFLAAGVPKEKLGVGLSFNGYVWSDGDVERPGQAWTTPPAMRSQPYYALAESYGLDEDGPPSPHYRWDEDAQAAYLSVEGGDDGARFVSYSDASAAAATVAYARRRGLGGVIVWDLGAGYQPERPVGRRDLLLQAVKRARLGAPEAAP